MKSKTRRIIHALALIAVSVTIIPAADADTIPKLKSAKGSAYPDSIDGFYTIPYTKQLKGLMVFVDFENLPGDVKGQRTPQEIAQRLLGIKKDGSMEIAAFFKNQSYGKLTFSVDIDYKWIRIPKKKSSEYPGSVTGRRPKEYLRDAMLAARSRGHKLSDYHILYVAAPKGLHVLSPKHAVMPTDLPEEKNIPRACVTFGDDGQASRIYHLAHETAHGMGLPDLYPANRAKNKRTAPGPWAIMSDNWRAISFCAWNRHLWGWLDDSRKALVKKGKRTISLAPLDSAKGTAMVVVPTGKFPQEVLVIENPRPWNDKIKNGVLIYRVDYSIRRGEVPIELALPSGIKDARSPNALWQPGQVYKSDTCSVRIVKKTGDAYVVEVGSE